MIGGVCIFLGVLISSIIYLGNNNILMSLIVSSLFMLLLGFVLLLSTSVFLRFLTQFVIVSIMVWYTGLRFETFGHSFGLSEQISLVFILSFNNYRNNFVTNAFNLMDGADGVTGCLSVLAIVGINFVEILYGGNNFNICINCSNWKFNSLFGLIFYIIKI